MAEVGPGSPDHLFLFMELLPELRIRVYEYLFEDLAASIIPPTLSLAQIQSLNDYQRPHIRNTLALLQTGRIFRTECLEVYSRLQKIQAAPLPDLISGLSVQLKGERDLSRCFFGHQKLIDLWTLEATMHKLKVLLHVVKYGPEEGHGEGGQSVVAPETTQGADASESATKRIKK
jgi:hypothetical protein